MCSLSVVKENSEMKIKSWIFKTKSGLLSAQKNLFSGFPSFATIVFTDALLLFCKVAPMNDASLTQPTGSNYPKLMTTNNCIFPKSSNYVLVQQCRCTFLVLLNWVFLVTKPTVINNINENTANEKQVGSLWWEKWSQGGFFFYPMI